MLIDCIVGLVCAGLLLFMYWSLKGLMLRPVRKGENSALKIRLTTFGAEACVAQRKRYAYRRN